MYKFYGIYYYSYNQQPSFNLDLGLLCPWVYNYKTPKGFSSSNK